MYVGECRLNEKLLWSIKLIKILHTETLKETYLLFERRDEGSALGFLQNPFGALQNGNEHSKTWHVCSYWGLEFTLSVSFNAEHISTLWVN